MSKNTLHIYINSNYIGILENDEKGGLVFQYDKNAKRLLSLSLPLKSDFYLDKECNGFFNGLLPETNETRKKIAEKYNIKNPNNDFEILKAIGHDCPGAVSFFEEKEEKTNDFDEILGEKVSEEELEKFIKELPQKPLGTGAKNLRLSLAGAQDKTAVVVVNNEVLLPNLETPTTHILKPAIKGLKNSVENEFICNKVAEKIGINVPKAEIREVGKTKYFLIERYDRIIQENKIKRLHQEDFCQALNIASAFKYQVNGGPDYKNCFEVLRKTSKPAVFIKQFLDLMIFNYLIMNNDAHGKNFSIIHNDNGEITLAPAYDILCTKVYKKLDYHMAMSIGNNSSCQEITPEDFKIFANEVGVNYSQLTKNILEQCEKLPIILSEVINSFDNSIGQIMYETISKNCRKNIKKFSK